MSGGCCDVVLEDAEKDAGEPVGWIAKAVEEDEDAEVCGEIKGSEDDGHACLLVHEVLSV